MATVTVDRTSFSDFENDIKFYFKNGLLVVGFHNTWKCDFCLLCDLFIILRYVFIPILTNVYPFLLGIVNLGWLLFHH